MNKKGLTLIEVILALAILGIIASAFLPLFSAVLKNVFNGKDMTDSLYKSQQQLEIEMEQLRDEEIDESDAYVLEVFGKTIAGHELQMDISNDEGKAYGEVNVFVPNYKVEYNVPVVNSVSMKAYKNNSAIGDYRIYPLDPGLKFKGDFVKGDQQDFLMNVYRWYMSPVSIEEPANYHDWIIIKEWNEARPELAYAESNDFSFIPNIKSNYDLLDFYNDFGLSEDEVANKFAGRYFVYSVTPYSLIGRIGREVFSNTVSTNRIIHIDPIFKAYEWVAPATFNLSEEQPTVRASMLYGEDIDVEVTWEDPLIDINGPDQDVVTRAGKVIGYEEPVEFNLEVRDDFVPSGIEILTEIMGEPAPTILQVPFKGNGPEKYTYHARVTDQEGHILSGEEVIWSLEDMSDNPLSSSVPITIDSSTGIVSVQNTADHLLFNIKVSLVSDLNISDTIAVRTSVVDKNESTVAITADGNTNKYTVYLYDKDRNPITIADRSVIEVNNKFTSNKSINVDYKNLASNIDDRYVSLFSYIRFRFTDYENNNDGRYTFSLNMSFSGLLSGSSTSSSQGGVKVEYGNRSIQITENRTIRVPQK